MVNSKTCILCGHETEPIGLGVDIFRWTHNEYDKEGVLLNSVVINPELRICPNCGTIKGYLEEKEGE